MSTSISGCRTDNVQSAIIPGSGHWVAEEAPEQLLSALTDPSQGVQSATMKALLGSLET